MNHQFRLPNGLATLPSLARALWEVFKELALYFLAVFVMVGPLAYGLHGLQGPRQLTIFPFYALAFSGMFPRRFVPRKVIAFSFAVFALGITLAGDPDLLALANRFLDSAEMVRPENSYWLPIFALIGGMGSGIAMAFIVKRRESARESLGLPLAWGVVRNLSPMVIYLAPLARNPQTASADLVAIALAMGALLSLCWFGSRWAGSVAGNWLRISVGSLQGAWDYLRIMAWPAAGFMVGYVGLVVWFGGAFAALHQADPLGAFSYPGELHPSGWEFLYFSMGTITSAGLGDISARSGAAKLAVSAELLLGTVWLAVVFAAVLAYLGPRFDAIHRQHKGGRGK